MKGAKSLEIGDEYRLVYCGTSNDRNRFPSSSEKVFCLWLKICACSKDMSVVTAYAPQMQVGEKDQI